MASKTSIFKISLTNIGKPAVKNADTDQTVEAKTCRIFWAEAVDFVLADFDWGFASKEEALAPAAEAERSVKWEYVYVYPNDCIQMREILHETTYQYGKPIDYEIGVSEDGSFLLIYTNQPNAIARYTKRVIDPNLFHASFVVTVAFYLSSLIAFPLTKKRTLRADMQQQYEISKFAAKGHVANETVSTYEPIPEALAVRD